MSMPKFRFRRDKKESFDATNPILDDGEMVFEFPNKPGENDLSKQYVKIRIGDGITKYKDLHYLDGMVPKDKVILYGFAILEIIHIVVDLVLFF